MAIRVTCPGCHKRFQVSDQFAGRSGPCPNCKTTIRVPSKDEELKIQGPESFGAGVRGAMTTKLIFREETRFNPIAATIVAAVALVVLIVTAILGQADFFASQAVFKSAVGLVLVAPPLVVSGYWFLRDRESLDTFHGMSLYLRTAACSLAYIILWGVYAYFSGRFLTGEVWQWVFVVPPIVAAGGLAASLSFDLEFGNGVFHYCYFLLVTVLLRWLAGMDWVWNIPEPPLF